jgi:hypothetical protein
MFGRATWRKITSPIICHPDLQQIQLLNGRFSITSFNFLLHLFHVQSTSLLSYSRPFQWAHMSYYIKYHWLNWLNSSLSLRLQYSYLPHFSLSFDYFLAIFLLYSNCSFLMKTAVKRFIIRTCGLESQYGELLL